MGGKSSGSWCSWSRQVVVVRGLEGRGGGVLLMDVAEERGEWKENGGFGEDEEQTDDLPPHPPPRVFSLCRVLLPTLSPNLIVQPLR